MKNRTRHNLALIIGAGWALTLGLGGGLVLAAALVWWVWRNRIAEATGTSARLDKLQSNVRLKDLPSPAELQALPAERLRLLVAALFEANGYTATLRPGDPDIDVELRRRGHTKASVLVCCRPANAGLIGAKPVRELFGTLVASGVEAGWFVATGGFATEARAVAEERGIELIDGEGLIERLRQLPTAELGQVLGRAGA
jgi:restriction endonuclease Mrr